ncbi:unnamed protein product, partial [Effrenium voratum]
MVADCLAAPLRGGAFDAVLSIAVLHHLSTPARRVQALREGARLLRCGGLFLVYCWSYEQDDQRSRSRHRFEAQERDVLVPWSFRTPGVKKARLKRRIEAAAGVLRGAKDAGAGCFWRFGVGRWARWAKGKPKRVFGHFGKHACPEFGPVKQLAFGPPGPSPSPGSSEDPKSRKAGSSSQRYCHVYREGELEELPGRQIPEILGYFWDMRLQEVPELELVNSSSLLRYRELVRHCQAAVKQGEKEPELQLHEALGRSHERTACEAAETEGFQRLSPDPSPMSSHVRRALARCERCPDGVETNERGGNAAICAIAICDFCEPKVLLLDFRGFGWSGGSPAMATLRSDAQDAMHALPAVLQEHGRDPEAHRGVVLFGRSIGSLCALHCAMLGYGEALVLDSPVTCQWPLEALPWAPLASSLPPLKEASRTRVCLCCRRPAARQSQSAWERCQLATEDLLQCLEMPLLYINGTADVVCPAEHARECFLAAGAAEKQFLLLEGLGHNEVSGSEQYRQALQEFLLRAKSAALPASPASPALPDAEKSAGVLA